MSRVLCRRGVSRGAVSRAFTADQLLDALQGSDTEHVYVELDSGGYLAAGGGRSTARACVCAGLAPHVPAAAALLALCAAPGAAPSPAPGPAPSPAPGPAPSPAPDPGPALRLRAAAALAPHADLQVWFAHDAAAALGLPFLTPANIRATHYECHRCGAAFDQPNPLKAHLFLGCAPFEPSAFWRRVALRLRTASLPPAPAPGPAPPARPHPAALEALATEWGRARDGHACVFCGKLYSRRYGLKIHLRTHTGYRPLRCRYCLRAFGDPSNLNKHVRLHAQRAPGPERAPHQCAVCGRALARRRDLERHARTHAPPADDK